MPESQLLRLPAELRLNIYNELLPFGAHSSEVKGLFMSCKLFHYEFSDLVPKRITKFLSGIEDEWKKTLGSELRISKPASFAAIKHLEVSVPLSIFRTTNVDETDVAKVTRPIPALLSSLASLHLSTLTFSFYENEGNKILPGLYHYDFFVEDFIGLLKGRKSVGKPGSPNMLDTGIMQADQVHFVMPPGFLDDSCTDGLDDRWEVSTTVQFPNSPFHSIVLEIVCDRLLEMTSDEHGILHCQYARDLHR